MFPTCVQNVNVFSVSLICMAACFGLVTVITCLALHRSARRRQTSRHYGSASTTSAACKAQGPRAKRARAKAQGPKAKGQVPNGQGRKPTGQSPRAKGQTAKCRSPRGEAHGTSKEANPTAIAKGKEANDTAYGCLATASLATQRASAVRNVSTVQCKRSCLYLKTRQRRDALLVIHAQTECPLYKHMFRT